MIPEKVVVCGLGPESMVPFSEVASDYFTIGVNDCDRYFTPNHLVVTDSIVHMKPEKSVFVYQTKAQTVWLNRDTIPGHSDVRQMQIVPIGSQEITNSLLGTMAGEGNPRVLSWIMSPFAAVMLAYKLGAKKIGMMGVDLVHPCNLKHSANTTVERFEGVREAFNRNGVEIVNLSKISVCLKSLPFQELSEF